MNRYFELDSRAYAGLFFASLVGLTLSSRVVLALEDAVPGESEIVLVDVPFPDLNRLKPEVRELIEPAIAYFEAKKDQLQGAELGRQYGSLGMFFDAFQMQKEARAAYRNALLLDSGNYRWSYLIALILEELNEPDRAIAMYVFSLSIEPSNIAARTRLGLQFVRQDSLQAGEEQLSQILKVDNRNAVALGGMGQIEMERKDYQRAISFFLRALDSQPKAGYLHNQVAAAYKAMGDEENAKKHLGQVNRGIPIIEDPIMAFVNAHRIAPAEYVRMGRELMRLGKDEQAVKTLRLATAVGPGFQPSFVALARSYRTLEQDSAAYATIDQALELSPSDSAANFMKAVWLDQDGHGDVAAGFYRSALIGKPEFNRARLLLANVLVRMGKVAEAVQQYQRVISADDQHMTGNFLLGMAYLIQKNCAAAIAPLKRSLELGPGNLRVRTVLARVFATCPSASAEQRLQSLSLARKLYEELPDADMAVTLAMALAANNEFKEAEEFQAQAMFEAIRDQDADRQAMLFDDMQRYQNNQSAPRAWPGDAEIFQPPVNLREHRRSAGEQSTNR